MARFSGVGLDHVGSGDVLGLALARPQRLVALIEEECAERLEVWSLSVQAVADYVYPD